MGVWVEHENLEDPRLDIYEAFAEYLAQRLQLPPEVSAELVNGHTLGPEWGVEDAVGMHNIYTAPHGALNERHHVVVALGDEQDDWADQESRLVTLAHELLHVEDYVKHLGSEPPSKQGHERLAWYRDQHDCDSVEDPHEIEIEDRARALTSQFLTQYQHSASIKVSRTTLYHVSPASARQSILAHGLDVSKGERLWLPTDADGNTMPEHMWDLHERDFVHNQYPEGIYFYEYPRLHDAVERGMNELGAGWDLWEVDGTGLHLAPDPDRFHAYGQFYTYDPVPPDHMRLILSGDHEGTWHPDDPDSDYWPESFPHVDPLSHVATIASVDPGWRTRIPFFLAPNGAFSMGDVGGEHWQIPDDPAVDEGIRDWFIREYPEWAAEGPDGEVWRDHQGQVNVDPESGAMQAHWPMDWETMQPKSWVTPEMQEAVLTEARKRWQASGPVTYDDSDRDNSLGPDTRDFTAATKTGMALQLEGQNDETGPMFKQVCEWLVEDFELQDMDIRVNLIAEETLTVPYKGKVVNPWGYYKVYDDPTKTILPYHQIDIAIGNPKWELTDYDKWFRIEITVHEFIHAYQWRVRFGNGTPIEVFGDDYEALVKWEEAVEKEVEAEAHGRMAEWADLYWTRLGFDKRPEYPRTQWTQTWKPHTQQTKDWNDSDTWWEDMRTKYPEMFEDDERTTPAMEKKKDQPSWLQATNFDSWSTEDLKQELLLLGVTIPRRPPRRRLIQMLKSEYRRMDAEVEQHNERVDAGGVNWQTPGYDPQRQTIDGIPIDQMSLDPQEQYYVDPQSDPQLQHLIEEITLEADDLIVEGHQPGDLVEWMRTELQRWITNDEDEIQDIITAWLQSQSHQAKVAMPMTQKQLINLKGQIDAGYPDTSMVVYQFPDGWTIREPTTFADVDRIGVLMDNCWALAYVYENQTAGAYDTHPNWPWHDDSYPADVINEQEYNAIYDSLDEPIETQRRALVDPDGIPHVAFFLSGHKIFEALGRHNSEPKPEYMRRLEQWKLERN